MLMQTVIATILLISARCRRRRQTPIFSNLDVCSRNVGSVEAVKRGLREGTGNNLKPIYHIHMGHLPNLEI